MAQPNTTSVLDLINSTGGLSLAQKNALRGVVELNPQVIVIPSNITTAADTTLVDLTGLKFSVKANRKYLVDVNLMCLAAGGSGIKTAIASASSTDPTLARFLHTLSITAAASTAGYQTDITSPSGTGATAAITNIKIQGFLHASVDTIIKVQAALNTGTTTGTIYAGSSLTVREVVTV